LCSPNWLAERGREKECRLLTSSAVGHDFDFEALDLEGGPRDPSFGTPLRRSDLVAVALGVAGVSIAVALVLTGGVATDTTEFAAVLVANIATLLVGGLLWRHARPSSPFGYLLLGEAVLVFLSSLGGSSVPALYLLGVLGAWAAALGLTWLLLVFPGARPDRAGWALMGTALAALVFGALPRILLSSSLPSMPILGECVHACPANPALVADAPAGANALRDVQSVFQTIWGIGLLVFMASALAKASYPRRRLLAPAYALAVPFMVVFTYNAVASVGVEVGSSGRAVLAGTRILLPLGFIVALLFARAYAGEALSLMASRLVGRPSAAAVEQLVRQVLDDPLARLAFWLPRRERFVDRHGNMVVLDPAEEGKTWRAFGQGESHVLAILHEPILGEDPELVGAVGATALLILENRRLEQDLLDSVGALRASQRRLVAAASSERRKIERDLHDGVQQKLVALRIHLELASEHAEGESSLAESLASLGEEFDDALDELRSVAHGIYPPLLADAGLDAALLDATRRSVVPVTAEIGKVDRLSEDAEAAIYYCCLEALQNVAKHAGHEASATLQLWQDRSVVHFRIRDDGEGFDERSAPKGAGLTNMADRIGAVGGTLAVTSEPGEGTTVEILVRVRAGNPAPNDAVHA
jgi:signal transduction histidine kinase